MRYARVYIDALGYELPPEVVTTHYLEAQLAPLYARLHLPDGQIEALTGVHERRFWPRGSRLSANATVAARRALAAADVPVSALGAVVYASVCRELHEPATACAVAAALGVGAATLVYDVTNACVGVLNAVLDLANRIELGHLRAGLVVACESAREINEQTTAALLARGDAAAFHAALATYTGGSGAAAVLLTDGSFPDGGRHRLLGGVARTAPEHHELCRWGYREVAPGLHEAFAHTDAPAVLRHGVALGTATWEALRLELGWQRQDVTRCITHQIGRAHRQQMLAALELAPDLDFPTYAFLGNMGTVSLPLSAALAEERGALVRGDRVAWLGIGSGLNCLMLGVDW